MIAVNSNAESDSPATLSTLSHLSKLESEAIFIIREAVAEAQNLVMLFSAGKDSTVMAHLAVKAFYPGKPPFPLLHVDSTWEFPALLEFRDEFARRYGFELIAHANEEGRAAGINPFDHGDRYTSIMRTEPLKRALNAGGYDIIFGGARRDEEKSRAKERIVSIRSAGHGWDPRQQRPELWRLYNARLAKGQSARVFPLSNWTEHDIWTYALLHKIELVPRCYAGYHDWYEPLRKGRKPSRRELN
jgi:sulfate adenylyltransferase subunit 2